MSSALLPSIDALAQWRRDLDQGITLLARHLGDAVLLDEVGAAQVDALRQRLANDRLVLAFVAEFSRGKSELINALFFADGGRRMMPATPGRTTMCPVELAWDPDQPPRLMLLPIDSRASGQTVAELRSQPELWQHCPLQADDPAAMAQAMDAVTRSQRVTVEQAKLLGFWSDERPDDNPPIDAQQRVEVPAWRHALLNYPHPLLRRGLVVIDTPGLNAVGAEPELTLGLLPSAHATVFVLAADTGVTRADLEVWRDHLSDQLSERFVVLNKIDALNDPLSEAAEVELHLQRQCNEVAQTLGINRSQVYPLSARAALVARVKGDEAGLVASRLPRLEEAVLNQLLPRRSQVLGRMVDDGVLALQRGADRRLGERRRRNADHLAELVGLRGKSVAKLQRVSQRLDSETEQVERCTPRLNALRAVLSRESSAALQGLSADKVREAVHTMRSQTRSSLFRLGAGRAFAALCEHLRDQLETAQHQIDEMDSMLKASLRQINAEGGLSLSDTPKPKLESSFYELDRIQASYSHYVSVSQVLRLSQPGFMEQFSRTLMSRLRVVFEGAAQQLETWVRQASVQMDEQLREHRRALRQRREAHARIRAAESGLERSIDELMLQQGQLQQLADRLAIEFDALRRHAATPPSDGGDAPNRLRLVPLPAAVLPLAGRA